MASKDIHGTVGIVRPTTRAGGFEDLIRMLPAQCRDIQGHLRVRTPIPGIGLLAVELP